MGGPAVTGRDPYFNPLDPDFLENPYPAYARLRAERPVYWHEGMGLWLVCGYRDCAALAADHARFAGDYRRAGLREDPDAVSVQTLDPPGQVAVRRLLVSAMRSIEPARIETIARADASKLLANAAARGTAEFVTEVATPFGLMAAAGAFGIDLDMGEHLTEVRQITDSMMTALRPELMRPGSEARRRLSQILAARLNEGADAGIVAHVRASPLSKAVPHDLLISSLRVTFMSIVNSAGRFFGLGLKALLSHSSLRGFRDAASPARAIHELVRFDTSVQVQERICVAPAKVGGVPIASGERVALIYGSANRDERVFPDAGQVILDRSPNPHLAFGRGTHSCLGSAVVISLSSVLLGMIAQDYPGTELVGRTEMDANPVSRGMRSMPIRLR
jgi:cytochrome P450